MKYLNKWQGWGFFLLDGYFQDKKETIQPNLVGNFLLMRGHEYSFFLKLFIWFKNIEYDYFRLKKPLLISGILIKEIYINPYWEKHKEEGISKELIIELVKLLPAERN